MTIQRYHLSRVAADPAYTGPDPNTIFGVGSGVGGPYHATTETHTGLNRMAAGGLNVPAGDYRTRKVSVWWTPKLGYQIVDFNNYTESQFRMAYSGVKTGAPSFVSYAGLLEVTHYSHSTNSITELGWAYQRSSLDLGTSYVNRTLGGSGYVYYYYDSRTIHQYDRVGFAFYMHCENNSGITRTSNFSVDLGYSSTASDIPYSNNTTGTRGNPWIDFPELIDYQGNKVTMVV